MAAARQIRVEIVADTRQFRADMTRARLTLERSWLRRLILRLELRRISRERKP